MGDLLSAAIYVGRVMRAIPAPTASWASIIGSIAWPGTILFLVIRFRLFLKRFLDTLASRLQTDHFKFGPFEITPNSQVISLDPEHFEESTEDYTPDDIQRMESLFEFISNASGFRRLAAWVNQNVEESLEISDFLTDQKYATERERAYQALVGERR